MHTEAGRRKTVLLQTSSDARKTEAHQGSPDASAVELLQCALYGGGAARIRRTVLQSLQPYVYLEERGRTEGEFIVSVFIEIY